MELKEFIKNTLIEISTAIKESQSKLRDTGTIINPSSIYNDFISIDGNGRRKVSEINFDIAISTEEKEDNTTGLSVVTGFFGAGNVIKEGLNTSLINRIQFKIPISFPIDDDLDEITKLNKEVKGQRKNKNLSRIHKIVHR